MKLLESMRSDNVRFALTYLTVFTVSVLALGYTTYQGVEQSLLSQLRERISAETSQLIGDYQDDGIDELRHDIHERLETAPVNRLRYSVRGPQNRVIFDQITQVELSDGWHEIEMNDGIRVLVYVEELEGGYVLTVGADLESLTNLSRATRHWVGGVLALTVLLGILGGVILLRRFRRRLEAFSESAARVGQGSLTERLETPSGDPELDQLACTINEMLERIEELVANARRVTSNIAHDLRTPLTRLRQKLERHRDEGGVSAEELDEAIDQLDDCLATFSALLRIAEIESGAQRRDFDEIDLAAVINRICDAYQPLVEEKGVALTCAAEQVVRVRGDQNLLGQAVANLIENALKHAHPASISVELEADESGSRITISDDGVGIPVDEMDQVLEPFHRLDESRSAPGNGLGLSLVRAIAQLHNANLRLEQATPGLIVTIEFREDVVHVGRG